MVTVKGFHPGKRDKEVLLCSLFFVAIAGTLQEPATGDLPDLMMWPFWPSEGERILRHVKERVPASFHWSSGLERSPAERGCFPVVMRAADIYNVSGTILFHSLQSVVLTIVSRPAAENGAQTLYFIENLAVIDEIEGDFEDKGDEIDQCDRENDDNKANNGVSDGADSLFDLFVLASGEDEGDPTDEDEDDTEHGRKNNRPGDHFLDQAHRLIAFDGRQNTRGELGKLHRIEICSKETFWHVLKAEVIRLLVVRRGHLSCRQQWIAGDKS